MGYNYYILVQVRKNKSWVNISYFKGSGSYGFRHKHYFISHMFEQPEYVENLRDCKDEASIALLYEMGEYQFIFPYETIRDDYIRYSTNTDLLNIKAEITEMIQCKITHETLQHVRDKINEFLETTPKSYNEDVTAYDELDKYYKLCENYHMQYDNVRIIFGYDP